MKYDGIMISHDRIAPFLRHTLDVTNFNFIGERYVGKVRDVYRQPERTILIATDRQSAFDVSWCTVPLKGQILNQLSQWWFSRIGDIVPHHVVAVPDPNVMVVKPLAMISLEIVVRGYLTGSTETSAWVNYSRGVRRFCGATLPEGLQKNDPLPTPIITPTTKGAHDAPISPDDIVNRGIVTREVWDDIAERSLALFSLGQKIASSRGLILVDTKYEMGFDASGTLTIGDEVHTPDSSRYWNAATFEQRRAMGQEPENLDKEFFRLWLIAQGFDPQHPDATAPTISDDARLMLAEKYLHVYERITGEQFFLPEPADVRSRIERNLAAYRVS